MTARKLTLKEMTNADSRSKRRKRRARRGWYVTHRVNRDPLARSNIKQQAKRDPDVPLVTSKRWVDYP